MNFKFLQINFQCLLNNIKILIINYLYFFYQNLYLTIMQPQNCSYNNLSIFYSLLIKMYLLKQYQIPNINYLIIMQCHIEKKFNFLNLKEFDLFHLLKVKLMIIKLLFLNLFLNKILINQYMFNIILVQFHYC